MAHFQRSNNPSDFIWGLEKEYNKKVNVLFIKRFSSI